MNSIVFKTSKSSTATKKPIGFLEGLRVQDTEGNSVLISDLWKNNTLVLKVLRRFGCPLCRYESQLLSELKPEFDSLDIKLAAIGFEDVGVDEFIAGGYWKYDLFINHDKTIHKVLNLPHVSVATGLMDIASKSTQAAIAAAKKALITGDLKGDGFQLGGTFVIEKGTGNMLYAFRQEGSGGYCSLKEIYLACGGNSEDITEKAPQECVLYTMNACTIGGKCD